MSEVRIINTYDQLVAAGGGVAIVPAVGPGRGAGEHGFHVYRVNAKGQQLVTDHDAAWYNYKQKWIHGEGPTHAARQADALAKAKAWVLDTYGEAGPWKRNVMRAYVPERIHKQFPITRSK